MVTAPSGRGRSSSRRTWTNAVALADHSVASEHGDVSDHARLEPEHRPVDARQNDVVGYQGRPETC